MSLPPALLGRLRALRTASPEYAPWLAALELSLSEIAAPTWSRAPIELAASRPDGAPLVHGATLTVPARAARRFLGKLLDAARPKGALRADRLDVAALLEAAIRYDGDRIEGLGREAGEGAAALAPVAQLAAAPLLHELRRAHGAALPGAWARGHCPLCGAWPAIAELRGIERAKRLRCGRCGADWEAPALGCPYCDERDHGRLVALLPEQGGQERKIDACEACRGYIKTLTTLGPWAPEAVALEDLGTIDLDLAAMERGYARPPEPGRASETRLVTGPEPWSLRGLLS